MKSSLDCIVSPKPYGLCRRHANWRGTGVSYMAFLDPERKDV